MSSKTQAAGQLPAQSPKQSAVQASEQSFTIRRRHAKPPLAPDDPMPARGKSQAAAGKPEAAKAAPRPKVQMRSYIPTNYLSAEQLAALRTIVGTYLPDLSDPAAVEVLLVLLEVCHILDLSDYRLRQVFGSRQLHALETWGDIVPPKQRPSELRRAWVWPSNTYQPKLYPIAEDGTIRIYAAPEGDAPA